MPGLSIAPMNTPYGMGTLGCIVRTTGKMVPYIPPGVYLLTNEHVACDLGLGEVFKDKTIIQPAINQLGMQVPGDYRCGGVIHAVKDAQNDCAICSVHWRRKVTNHLPKRDWKFNHTKIRGIGAAQVGDMVYKFGAATGYTKGQITNVNHQFQDGGKVYTGTIIVTSLTQEPFSGPGDSGAVIIRQRDDVAVGLMFLGGVMGVNGAVAYDLTSQLQNFCNPGGRVTLV